MAGGIGKRILVYRNIESSPVIGSTMCILYDRKQSRVLSATSLHVLLMAGASNDACRIQDAATGAMLHEIGEQLGVGHEEGDVYFFQLDDAVGLDQSDFTVMIPGSEQPTAHPIIGSGREATLVQGAAVYVAYTDSNGLLGAEAGTISEITDTSFYVTGLALAQPGCSGAPLFIWHGEGHTGCCLIGMLKAGTCALDDPRGIEFVRFSALQDIYQGSEDGQIEVMTRTMLMQFFPEVVVS